MSASNALARLPYIYGLIESPAFCERCGTSHSPNLHNSWKEWVEKVMKAFERASKFLHEQGDYRSDYLSHEEVTPLIAATQEAYGQAIESHIAQDVPAEMQQYFRNNVFVFSACKTHSQLKEVSQLLLTATGERRPYKQFEDDVKALNIAFNQNYLQAEYNFATASSQMAAKWIQFERDGDRYHLQYRTASDDRVRESHSRLDNVTLPMSDPFWDYYYAPNGWRCRCTVVQVGKDKYQVSDSGEAKKAGEKATTHIAKDGSNALEMFRFNPGKQRVLFPKNHPYFQDQKEVEDKAKKI